MINRALGAVSRRIYHMGGQEFGFLLLFSLFAFSIPPLYSDPQVARVFVRVTTTFSMDRYLDRDGRGASVCLFFYHS